MAIANSGIFVKKTLRAFASLLVAVPSFVAITHASAAPLTNPTPTCSASCSIDFTYQSANFYEWTAPVTGTYTFQAWGAQGGGGESNFGTGGPGGYSKGDYSITAGTVIYVYVGQQGRHSSSTSLTAYNGGGAGNPASPDANSGFSGGGATHASISSGLLSTLSSSQSNILIVAGGGGGAAGSTTYYGVGYNVSGGAGGGSTGGTPVDSNYAAGRTKGLPGTQSAGGLSATYNGTSTESPSVAAGFGQGASSGTSTADGIQGGGGGGGFYGGGAGSHLGGAGAGGSGYVANLTNTTISAGSISFIQPDGSTSTGRLGNGYLRITYPAPVIANVLGYTLSSTPRKGATVTLAANTNVPAKITFLLNGKRIPKCISISTTGSGPYSATCSWKPTGQGSYRLTFYVNPTNGSSTPITSEVTNVTVARRTSLR